MSLRVYLRTLRFVAYNWAPPFFFGALFAMAIAWWDVSMIAQAAESGFNAAISACAPEMW